ncbi:MAG: DUF447 family protein [Methanobacteriaceae archaeon]|jgi:hypothetical protein|nr:DUF447 family protein [Methanobacteriaceae archaeon]
MLDLHSISMRRGMLYETIITTVNSDKTPNAAPIGVICKDKDEIVVYLHEGSRTIKNIKNNGTFVVNILKDPLVFVESTMGNLSPEYFLEFNDNYAIQEADAYFLAKVYDLKDIERKDQFGIDKSSIIRADVEGIVKNKDCVEPLNRAMYGVVEALVYLTRKDMVSGETEKLYNLRMKEISRIVNKVGAKEHKEAIKKVMTAWNEGK